MSKYLKFWGTRGSCPVSGGEFAEFGGNTSCLEVSYEGSHFIIDAGTGIRPLGAEILKKRKKILLILSHTHWDHVMGFPFFAPLYDKDSEIDIWSPSENKKSCKVIFGELMSAEFFPVGLEQLKAKIQFHSIEFETPIRVGPLTIHFYRAHHPSLAYAFKIETPHQTIGYASDNEMCKGYHGDLSHAPEDPGLVSFFSKIDFLIHEAQYFPEEYRKKVGWGHSSTLNAISLIQKTRVRKWLVVHHDPQHTDADLHRLAQYTQKTLQENRIPCEAQWIGDGRVFPLS